MRFITRLGRDAFAELARATWREAGVVAKVVEDDAHPTGSAYIFVEDATGDNAIIIAPGAAGRISVPDLEGWSSVIASASVFLTQLEQPLAVAHRALARAKEAGATTVFDPAPATGLPEGMLALCDYVTPNEGEAEKLTGLPVRTVAEARRAADAILGRSAGTVVLTLGDKGVLLHDSGRNVYVPPFVAGPVVETTGAGDAFNGGFAVALAEGADPIEAVRFGCATAAIAVTRAGTARPCPRAGRSMNSWGGRPRERHPALTVPGPQGAISGEGSGRCDPRPVNPVMAIRTAWIARAVAPPGQPRRA